MGISKNSTPVQVMNAVRKEAFDDLCSILSQYYEIGQTGDSSLVINVGTSPTGEPIYAEISPTIKNYITRITPKKTILAFDFEQATADYTSKVEERKKKAEEIAKKKAEKIVKDKERREKLKAEKENSGKSEKENSDNPENSEKENSDNKW